MDFATEYADLMRKCVSLKALRIVGDHINTNIKEVSGFEEWLRDCYRSQEQKLKSKPIEEVLTKEGMKYLRG